MGEPSGAVDQQDREVAPLDRVEALHHGEDFDRAFGLPLRADPRGVDQQVLPSVPLHHHVDRVARGAGDLRGDDPLEPRQRVDERRLSHVRPPHHGDPRKVGVLRVRLFPDVGPGGNPRDDRLEQFGYPRAVLGGNGMDRIDGEGVELGNAFPAFLRVHLVRGEEDRLPPLAQHPGDLLVEGEQPVAGVDQEDDQVGFVDRPQDLPADLRKEVVLLPARHVPPGVDEKEMATVVLHRLGDEVARDPRLVERDGAALPRHPVEQGGLPHVRTPHQRHRELSPAHIPDASTWIRSSTSPVPRRRTVPGRPATPSPSPARGARPSRPS